MSRLTGTSDGATTRGPRSCWLMLFTELLTVLFNAGIAISVVATVMSLGMSFTVGQLVAPLHRVTLVLAMVVLNAAVIPAAAWGIAKISPMD